MRDTPRAVRLRVGRNVRHFRRLRGLSQEKLAEQVGNTNKHLGLVERGQVNVTIDILTAIAANLSVNVRDLFGPAPGNARRGLSSLDLEQIKLASRILDRVARGGR